MTRCRFCNERSAKGWHSCECIGATTTRARELKRKPSAQGIRPKNKDLSRDSLLVVELHERAKEASRYYRKLKGDDGVHSARVEVALSEAQAAWDRYYGAYRLVEPGTPVAKVSTGPPFFGFEIDGHKYRVAEPGRRAVRLVSIWSQHVVGRKVRRHENGKTFHLGLLHEFGDLMDPPQAMLPARLAQRFKIPENTVRAAIKRYQRKTRDTTTS